MIYDTLLYPFGRFRHRAICRQACRSQSHTYTCFFRAPLQLEALTGPVLAFLGEAQLPQPLRINVFAASTGAEAYTVASLLASRFPGMESQISASDIHSTTVAKAVAARYSRQEVYHNPHIPSDFVERTFDHDPGGDYVVKPEIRRMVSFESADLLDGALGDRFAPADIVLAQNVMFHLDPEAAVRAFHNVAQCLKPRSALFIDGMDLDMKQRLTRELGLVPLSFRHKEIYSYARRHVPLQWWRYYYGAEPYRQFVRDRTRRYSTIFLKGVGTGEWSAL